jgi:hypothetical protein
MYDIGEELKDADIIALAISHQADILRRRDAIALRR